MKTTSVVDGKLSNEQLGGFYRRVNELTRRMNEGTLMYNKVMSELQRIIEGCINPQTISINRSKFNLAEFIGKDWKVWRGPVNGCGLNGDEDIDSRSLVLTEINADSLLFESCLQEGEQRITGEEKLKRLKAANLVRLGGNAFLGLWRDYEANKENSVLEYLYRTRKITYLDFFGLILRSPDSDRCVLYLYRDSDGAWTWYYFWLGCGWDAGARSAVLASST